jgi:hypothetical protein
MRSAVAARSRADRARQVGPVLALVGWTLFTWLNRIRNVAADASLGGWSRTWSLAVAVGFSAAGLVLGMLVVAWLAGDAEPVPPPVRRFALILAAVGAGWWGVRGVQIVLADHGLGFTVVHSILAVVTVALGSVVFRWARTPGAAVPGTASLAGDG